MASMTGVAHRRRRFGLAGVGLCAAVRWAAAGAAESVPNAGFEETRGATPPPTGWTVATDLLPQGWSGDPEAPWAGGLVGEAHAGKYALSLGTNGAPAHVHSDAVPVLAGEAYELSAWARDGRVSLAIVEFGGGKRLRTTPPVAEVRAGSAWAQGGGYYLVAPGVDQIAADLSVDSPTGARVDDLGLRPVERPRAAGPEVVLETAGVKLVIGPDGGCTSLYDKTLGAERNLHPGRPLMHAALGNWTYPATRCAAQGDRLDVTFGEDKAGATVEVQSRSGFIGLLIRDYHPADLEQLTLLDLLVTEQAVVGGSFGVLYDSRSALGIQTLHFSGLQLLGLAGPDRLALGCTYNRLARDREALYQPPAARGCALLACQRDRLALTLQAIEETYGLPSPKIDGVWGKLSPAMRGSYLFLTDLTAATVDKAIAYAQRGRFGYVLIAQDSWSNGGGTFAINEKGFPGGLPTLKASVERLQQAGLKVGLHFLTAGMVPTDPLVTPVPDRGIYSDAAVPLAAAVDEAATFIPTATAPPVEFTDTPMTGPSLMAPRPFEISCPGGGTVLWIGDELVLYGRPKREPPYGFEGCQRGHWGTRPAPHGAGDPVKHLYMMAYGPVLMDADSDLLERVAQRVADVMNDCQCDGLYFDGSELLQGDHAYYNARLQTAYLDKIRRKDLIIQGSSYSPYTWHSMCRMASADGFRQIKLFLDRRTPTFQWYFDTLMPLDIGWYAINTNIRPDDVEYVCSRALGFGSSISVQTSTESLDTVPQAGEMIDLVAAWEELRLSGRVAEALREQMRQPGNEFHLIRRGDEDTLVPVEYSAWACSPLLAPEERTAAGEKDPLRPPDDAESSVALRSARGQPARRELQLEVRELVAPGPAYAAGVPLELFETDGNDWRPTATAAQGSVVRGKQAAREGVTQEITLVTDDVREGKSACRFSATSTLAEAGGWASFGTTFDPPISLRDYAAIGLWVKGDARCEVLKLQLWDTAGHAQDHNLVVGFSGWRYIELPRPTGLAMDYERIASVCFYYNAMPGEATCATFLDGVRAMASATVLRNPALIVNGEPITFPATMNQGDRLMLRSNGECWLYPAGGQARRQVAPQGSLEALAADVTVTARPASHRLRFRGAMLWPPLGTVLPRR